MANHYDLLGVEADASADEIKKAYRQRARAFHPDINPEAGNLQSLINGAYSILSDASSRAAYDRALAGGSRAQPPPPPPEPEEPNWGREENWADPFNRKGRYNAYEGFEYVYEDAQGDHYPDHPERAPASEPSSAPVDQDRVLAVRATRIAGGVLFPLLLLVSYLSDNFPLLLLGLVPALLSWWGTDAEQSLLRRVPRYVFFVLLCSLVVVGVVLYFSLGGDITALLVISIVILAVFALPFWAARRWRKLRTA